VKKRLLALTALLTAAPLHAEIILPDLGEASRTYLSANQEEQLANNIMRDVYNNPRYLDDAEIETYLNDLGYRLVASSGANQRDYRFFVIEDPTINAFALPGGYIGVHTGLFTNVDDESQLASVLAHEIAHVSQNHLARMIANQTQSFLPTMGALALAILAARSNPEAASAAIATAQAVNIQNQLNFSRDFEREADRLGFDTLVKSGFDPHGMPAFFEKLQRVNRFYEGNAPAYLRTHPLSSERVADMESRADKLPYKQISNSGDFLLVKAKIRAMQGGPQEAIAYFRDQIGGRKSLQPAVSQYGLAVSLLRAGDLPGAERAARQAESTLKDPMIDNLLGRILLTAGKNDAALSLYRAALTRSPDYRPLGYGYIDALLATRQTKQADDWVGKALKRTTDDARLYKSAAKVYAAAGQRLASHRALAESLVLQGNLPAAVEQLDLGLKAGDGDFYALSEAEARRRVLREQLQASKS
jgi:predicted Zn-dependent protease